MDQATIPIDFSSMASAYPFRTEKKGHFGGRLAHPELRKLMNRNPGTPCCVQVSHCLNMCGFPIPKHYPEARRPNDGQTIDGTVYYYLLAVDEMEAYLTDAFGPGEAVRDESKTGLRKSSAQVRSALRDRRGILVMREGPYGLHTELWDGMALLQKDMATDHLLTRPRVLFWECTLAPPSWLSDYMSTQA